MIGADIAAGVRALPARHRVIVYLAGVRGLSYREISQATGIPAESVKSGLHRSRDRLRSQLAARAPRPATPAPPAGRDHQPAETGRIPS